MKDGKMTTKWDYRSGQSIKPGRFKYHPSSVILALNIKSDRITAQYHAVVYQDFSSIDNPKNLLEHWYKNLAENICHSTFEIDNPPKEYGFKPEKHTHKDMQQNHPTLPDTYPLNGYDPSHEEG